MKSAETSANSPGEIKSPLAENSILDEVPILQDPAKKPHIETQKEALKKTNKTLISSGSEIICSNRQDYLMFNRFKNRSHNEYSV